MLAHVPIDYVDCKEQGLGKQLEVIMNLNHPVHQSGSDGLINLDLLTHIHWVSVPFRFCLQHAGVDLVHEFSDMVDVSDCMSISLMNIAEYLFLAPLVEHLQLLVKTYSW